MKIKGILFFNLLIVMILGSCLSDTENDSLNPGEGFAVLLVIDEDSIDNGNEPNNFSDVDVNDPLAAIGLRTPLKYFQDNVGQTIELYTGQVGDEGWFALKNIPNRWKNAGPSVNGARNYLTSGPGLGAPNVDDDREIHLDEIPEVTPLRATGLKMLVGLKILAVVYDSDISINYSSLEGNLKGANLGMVALEVTEVRERTGGSSSDLPIVRVKILNVNEIDNLDLRLFSNAPVPQSSSEPFDVKPPVNVAQGVFVLAD